MIQVKAHWKSFFFLFEYRNIWKMKPKYSKRTNPPGMRRCRDVSFRSHIGRNWYVNETDLFEAFLWRLIGTYIKPTNLRRRNDVPIDT